MNKRDITLNEFVGAVSPTLLWAYKRYQRDLKENIYKVGGVFYTVRPGYGPAGRHVIMVKIEDICFPNKEDGVMGKAYHFKELKKDYTGKLVPSDKDLGGLIYTTFELFHKDDPRIKDVESYCKSGVYGSSDVVEIYEYFGIYTFLMPEDEYLEHKKNDPRFRLNQ